MYRVKGCTNAPSGMVATTVYLMKVEAVDTVVLQTFYDHAGNDTHQRAIVGSTVGSWSAGGKKTNDAIATINTNIGTITNLRTSDKTSVVNAVNEVQAEVDTALKKASDNATAISQLGKDSTNHNHDSTYLKLTGGSLSGGLSVANNQSISGKNTGGSAINIGRISVANAVILGDTNAQTVIHTNTRKTLKFYDGTDEHSVWHTGNVGSGSGLDADKLDGIHASQFARVDEQPNFKQNLIMTDGKDIVLRAPSGSMNSGDLVFAEGGNGEIGRIFVDSDGTLVMRSQFYGDMKVRHDGVITSGYGMEFNSKNKETDLKFRADDSDKGMGFYMNNSTKQLGMYDWQHDRFYFTADRRESSIHFFNQIKIQGKRLHIQENAPTFAEYGDIWIDI
ncbi:pyocin knob domain-containing protein [Bacillus mycoides]|uniref:pyocin knob domain-containing protein n=1 Tax=Bacillus mycoides TaxID=1405 RepID=UPI003D0799C1